jgi:hypothetical protein
MCIALLVFPPLMYLALKGAWFISIRQKAESHTIYLSTCWSMVKSRFSPVCTAGFTTYEVILAFADYMQCGLLVLMYAMTLYYKFVIPGRLPFLLMPCHLHTKALLFCMFSNARKDATNKLHYVALCMNWGTWLALTSPDTKSMVMPFEREHFWLSHVILLTLPITWVLRGRFHIYHGWHGLVVAWCSFCLITIFPVQLISLVLSRNVTYMMVPPKPMQRLLGQKYRKWFGLVCVPVLVLFTRYVFAEILILLGRLRHDPDAQVAVMESKASVPNSTPPHSASKSIKRVL